MSYFLIGRSRQRPNWHVVPMHEDCMVDGLPVLETFDMVICASALTRLQTDDGDQYLEVQGVSHSSGRLAGHFRHQSLLPTPEPGCNHD